MLDASATRALADTRFAVRWVESIASTNTELLEQAREGAAEGAVLVADHQTAGRGRLGRVWTAPPGSSLLFSVLLRPESLGLAQAHTAVAAVALAASDACAAEASFQPGLKWPNDLVVDDRKLGGILAESVTTGDRLHALVVGLGLNVNWPAELPEELVSIAVAANHVAGRPLDRAGLLVRLLLALEGRYARLVEPGGPAALMVDYRARCSTLGRTVRVELASGSFTGVAADVTDEGHLVVETEGDRRVVTVGDVVHVR